MKNQTYTYHDDIRTINWTTGTMGRDEFHVSLLRFYWVWLTHLRTTRKWKNMPVITVMVKNI